MCFTEKNIPQGRTDFTETNFQVSWKTTFFGYAHEKEIILEIQGNKHCSHMKFV